MHYHSNHFHSGWTVLTIGMFGTILSAFSYYSTYADSANHGAALCKAYGIPFGRDGIDIVVVRSDYYAEIAETVHSAQ